VLTLDESFEGGGRLIIFHAVLDAAVAQAYGWPADISENE
jgi:hypothetical protein